MLFQMRNWGMRHKCGTISLVWSTTEQSVVNDILDKKKETIYGREY